MTDRDAFAPGELVDGPFYRTQRKVPVRARSNQVSRMCVFSKLLYARVKYVAEKEGVSIAAAIRGLLTYGLQRYQKLGQLPRRT